jgi:uncharacterized protein YbbK (DUF523 family)
VFNSLSSSCMLLSNVRYNGTYSFHEFLKKISIRKIKFPLLCKQKETGDHNGQAE